MSQNVVALSTCGTAEEARTLAETLLEERLAACVNILPGLTSIYRWKDQIQETPEVLLIIKTRADLMERLSERLRHLHSYEVPELIALPIVSGLPAYLSWLEEETSAPGRENRAEEGCTTGMRHDEIEP